MLDLTYIEIFYYYVEYMFCYMLHHKTKIMIFLTIDGLYANRS